VHLRQEAQRDAARRARQRRQEKESASRRERAELAERAGRVRVDAHRRAQQQPVAESVVDDAEPLYDAVADEAWQPVPVPLPTYVTAPKAPRSVRTIDLTKPGAYSAGRQAPADEEAAAPPVEVEVDVEVEADEPRRAVNG
jgi:hypothetical protein